MLFSCIMCSSQSMLKSLHKDGLCIFLTSSIIYKFKCQSEADCMGKTTQFLEKRIVEQSEKVDCKNLWKCSVTHRSAISEHLIKNWECASCFYKYMFSILSGSHSSYHLKVFKHFILNEDNHPYAKKKCVC